MTDHRGAPTSALTYPETVNTAQLDALYKQADELEDQGDDRRAFRLFLRGAEAGAADCADRVGSCYGAGTGTRRSPSQALRWYRIAYRRGWSPYNLAVEYASQGRWVLARNWFERALAEGEKSAGVDVALCMLTGRGARLNAARAYRLVANVARMRPPHGVSPFEHEEAMALLGVMTATGVGTRKKIARARQWLARANAHGDYPEAERALKDLDRVTALDVVRSPPWRPRAPAAGTAIVARTEGRPSAAPRDSKKAAAASRRRR
jgi:TPR repeat protein